MEFEALAKVVAFVSFVKHSGYLFVGGVLLKTGYQYVVDYRDSVAQEKKGRM